MTKLKAIIIDDETHCVETLEWQLTKYCPEVELIGTANSAQKGLTLIHQLNPDLVFLDIEMPQLNGFDMLKQVEHINFSIVFTTAYDQFALQAIKVSALDYLVKPIDDDELVAAVEKAKTKTLRKNSPTTNPTDSIRLSVEHLLEQIQTKHVSNRIFLPTQNGLEFVDTIAINRCESDSNYTTVFLNSGEKIVISKTLKEIEEMIVSSDFFRVHNSHLVNLNEVQKYVKGDGGHLIMKDSTLIPVSRSKKNELLKHLNIL